MKRPKYDVRRVKTTVPYAVSEIAKLFDVRIATVRRWIKNGLPCIDQATPALIHGSELKKWLEKQKQKRKRKCGPDQMYCLKCRDPRLVMPGSVIVVQRNDKTSMIKASCIDCGTLMHQAASAETALEWAKPKPLRKVGTLHLVGSGNSPLNRPLASIGKSDDELTGGGGQIFGNITQETDPQKHLYR